MANTNGKKTYWSVKYAVWGAYSTSERWFDSEEEAIAFASGDYRDAPIRHTYKDAKRIAKIEEILEAQRATDAYNAMYD